MKHRFISRKSPLFFPVFLLCAGTFLFSSPLASPTWGFSLDLPEGYNYIDTAGNDRFSFENSAGAKFDLVVYNSDPDKPASYSSLEALVQDVRRRLKNSGDAEAFEYRQKKAYIVELSFSMSPDSARSGAVSGWALFVELRRAEKASGQTPENAPSKNVPPGQNAGPLLAALAYGPEGRDDLLALHLSALDSIAPEPADRLAPGPITEFTYPRKTRVKTPLFGLDIEAWIFEEDAEAAQSLIDREFQVLTRYANAPQWQEAWSRFYRAVYRDSFDRLADAAFKIERGLNAPSRETADMGGNSPPSNRDFAAGALRWVQSFTFERDLLGSDLVNLVTAAVEGRGDCDSRALLWAVIMKQAAIPSAIMVSRHYSHALGLADLEGQGARFPMKDTNGKDIQWLVAETTAKVSIGLIGETVSDVNYWLGIQFE